MEWKSVAQTSLGFLDQLWSQLWRNALGRAVIISKLCPGMREVTNGLRLGWVTKMRIWYHGFSRLITLVAPTVYFIHTPWHVTVRPLSLKRHALLCPLILSLAMWVSLANGVLADKMHAEALKHTRLSTSALVPLPSPWETSPGYSARGLKKMWSKVKSSQDQSRLSEISYSQTIPR